MAVRCSRVSRALFTCSQWTCYEILRSAKLRLDCWDDQQSQQSRTVHTQSQSTSAANRNRTARGSTSQLRELRQRIRSVVSARSSSMGQLCCSPSDNRRARPDDYFDGPADVRADRRHAAQHSAASAQHATSNNVTASALASGAGL